MTQGLDTSILRMGNIVLNPRVWIPPTLASMITDPVVIVVFGLKNIPADFGMGTCDLVGPVGVCTTMEDSARIWSGILLVCFVPPAMLTSIFREILRRMG